MKYNLDNDQELEQAVDYLAVLSGRHQQVEIKRIVPRRTLNQNAYLHLIIGAFGDHFGYTAEEAKFIYKYINKDVYMYKKNKITFWRSSADLTKEEMQRSIDVFIKAAARNDCQLPLAIDQEWIRRIENDLERTNYYAREP